MKLFSFVSEQLAIFRYLLYSTFIDNSSSEYVTTEDDHLVITARVHKTSWLDWDYKKKKPIVYTKNYTSAMIQTWNKFCFTGGVLELSIDLPGDAYSGGLWPAAWLNGNLARVTYDKSTMVMLILIFFSCNL